MTSPLTPRTMASLQRLSVSFMEDSGTILRPVLIDDGAGGTYPDPSGPQQIGPILGLFWTVSGNEAVAAAQLSQQGRYRWAVPIGTDIRATDQVVLLGVLFNIVWVPPVAYHDADRIIGLEESGTYTLIVYGGILTESGMGLLTEAGDRLTIETGDHLTSLMIEFGDLLLTEAGDRLLIEA